MPCTTQTAPVVAQICVEAARCPAQILVIDRLHGPANVLIDTISLLIDREVSVTSVDEHADALRALDYYHFDLVVVGLEDQHPIQLTVLPPVHQLRPEVPVLAVGRSLPAIYKQYARNYGANEVLNMPERASELKRLTARLSERYIRSASAQLSRDLA